MTEYNNLGLGLNEVRCLPDVDPQIIDNLMQRLKNGDLLAAIEATALLRKHGRLMTEEEKQLQATEVEIRKQILVIAKEIVIILGMADDEQKKALLVEATKAEIQSMAPTVNEPISGSDRQKRIKKLTEHFGKLKKICEFLINLQTVINEYQGRPKKIVPWGSDRQAPNYYDVLGIPENADSKLIKASYRRLCQIFETNTRLNALGQDVLAQSPLIAAADLIYRQILDAGRVLLDDQVLSKKTNSPQRKNEISTKARYDFAVAASKNNRPPPVETPERPTEIIPSTSDIDWRGFHSYEELYACLGRYKKWSMQGEKFSSQNLINLIKVIEELGEPVLEGHALLIQIADAELQLRVKIISQDRYAGLDFRDSDSIQAITDLLKRIGYIKGTDDNSYVASVVAFEIEKIEKYLPRDEQALDRELDRIKLTTNYHLRQTVRAILLARINQFQNQRNNFW